MKDKILKSTERISYQIGTLFVREEAILRATEQMNLQIEEANTEEEKEELRELLKETLDLLR